MINGKRLKKLSLALATLLCGQHINAQWTITEPTTDYSGEVLLSNHSLKIMSNPLNFQGKLKGTQAYIDISPEFYEEGTNILNVGGGRGSMYNLFLMTTEGDFNMAGKFSIGSSYSYPIFEIDRQRGESVSISISGERSYLPLNINASEISTNGDVKTGTILEMGSNKGGHLIINSYDKSGTIFTNETIGNVYRPMNFFASEYNFNLNAKQDTFKILGGGLWVDGEITCKDQLKVAEINTDHIKAKDINVEMNQAADYVFDEQYNLQPLNEVESYVKSNKHLPGIPSATEMAQEGMSVSKMSNLLLEKVEELTLHMIQIQKEMNQLREENNALKSEVQELRNK